jgi:hypothetical protein
MEKLAALSNVHHEGDVMLDRSKRIVLGVTDDSKAIVD